VSLLAEKAVSRELAGRPYLGRKGKYNLQQLQQWKFQKIRYDTLWSCWPHMPIPSPTSQWRAGRPARHWRERVYGAV